MGHPYRLFYEEFVWDVNFSKSLWEGKNVTLYFCGNSKEAQNAAEKYRVKHFSQEPSRFRKLKIYKLQLQEVEWEPTT